ncbi:kinase-like domain-containing protein [Rhizophagus clarus]|uniref:Kinase-like domain-containing protein n=1 Tax=Rhizophagus clarus TaxID=94130 RepID=A0A8H3KUM9_9GLOM|nr:kinase-like domain-containing protein [Rhizophagus clarus]
METGLNKSNITDGDSNNKNCSYCNKPFTEKLWCKECDPFRIIEGWTSGNPNVDKFIKDTMYDIKIHSNRFFEWIPFDKFTDIKEIGRGGFSKVYSATRIDGKSFYYKDNDGNYRKEVHGPEKVALRRLNGSQNMSDKYLSELKLHWNLFKAYGIKPYGLTKDPETKEFIMIMELANESLRNTISRYFHKDIHSGNILKFRGLFDEDIMYYISDFGLCGPSNEQKSDGKVYGVLPYIAPEVLSGKPYTTSSDIYSIALEICDGLRPEFGKGTPEIYRKLAYNCMNAHPKERPTAKDLEWIFYFWSSSGDRTEHSGHKKKEIQVAFEEADKEIPNISTSYEKDSDAVYTSRAFAFSNSLPEPSNSYFLTAHINNRENDFDPYLDDKEINLLFESILKQDKHDNE